MSIATELTLLANSKQAIKNSINQKGGSITDSTPFADYSTAIDNLPSGGSGNPLLKSIDVDDFSGTTFRDTKNYITSAVVPNGVTTIDYGAFQSCSSLTSVRLPNTLTTIGTQAFANTNIANLVIPNSVTTLNQGALRELRSTSLTLPNAITSLPNYCIYNSQYLTSLIIPSTVTSIGDYAINNCKRLTYVIVESTTTPTLGTSVFDSTNNCPIYVPAESVDTYKAASGWSTYASRIYPITQVATVDGNPVYNYDLGNTSSTTILSTEIDKLPTGTSIEFAEGITNMGGSISGYTTVTLPSTFATFNDQNMIGSSVTTLTMKSTTPPTAERNNLGGAGLTAIYVPASAVDTYKAASGWSNFASIIEGLPSPTPSVTSITFAQYKEATSPDDRGDFEGCSGDVNVDAFESTGSTGSDAFDSDIKAAGIVLVEDNNGNDITSQCTFSSNDYSVWDSTTDPEYDGESEAYYEWRLDASIGESDEQSPQSATITATYGNLSDTFTIEWTTTSNCEEPEPEPEPDPEEPEE